MLGFDVITESKIEISEDGQILMFVRTYGRWEEKAPEWSNPKVISRKDSKKFAENILERQKET